MWNSLDSNWHLCEMLCPRSWLYCSMHSCGPKNVFFNYVIYIVYKFREEMSSLLSIRETEHIAMFCRFTCLKAVRGLLSLLCNGPNRRCCIRPKPGASSPSPRGVQGPSTCAMVSSLPRCVSREPDLKQSSQDTAWRSHGMLPSQRLISLPKAPTCLRKLYTMFVLSN